MNENILIEKTETDLDKKEFVSYGDAISHIKSLIDFSNLAKIVKNYKINQLENGNFKAFFVWK